jgi:hypothetical protein
MPPGAPKGNLNALKTGRYSKRVRAMRAAIDAMPATASLLARCEGDRRKLETLALGLQYQAEMMLAVARGGSPHDLLALEKGKRLLAAFARLREDAPVSGASGVSKQ